MNKYCYTQKNSVEKGSSPLKPSSSRDDKSRRMGEDFLGKLSQERSSPSENFGDPPITRNFQQKSRVKGKPVVKRGNL